MSEYQEFTGRTVEEAIRAAREALGVSDLADLDFEILTPGSRGVLGMGAEPARIVAAARSALGGVTPRKEAAAAEPLPAPRPPRDDRGARDQGRDRARRDQAPPRPQAQPAAGPAAQPMGANEHVPLRAPRPERPPRDDRRARDRGRGGRDDRRGAGLSQREAAEVASARASLTTEREEIQAAEATPEALAAGTEIVSRLVELMGYRANVSVATGDTAKIDVTGVDDSEREALGALIGRKGERLSALQHLVNLMLSRRMGAWTRVLVDVEDYRGRRERQLGEIARRAAERVIESGTMLQLEPMPALERRWIHLALRDVPGVATQSIGDEPMRRVVVLRATD
ncbi:MAG: RNA-binding cell elongation regulator Jag/EloR [Chloroflexota bacterium]